MTSKVIPYHIVFLLIFTIGCGESNGRFITGSDNQQVDEEARKPGPPVTYNYKKGDSYSLDITVHPSNSVLSNAPAIVFFFGGGWEFGSINQFREHAKYFAQRGVTALLVDYRVANRHKSTPFESVDDAYDALRFIFRNSSQLGIDNNKIIVSGGSAGGHLALMSSFLISKKSEYKPAALVVFNPVVDTGPEGYGYDIIGENYKDISPIDNVPTNPPPVINFQGTSDNFISVEEAERFCQEVVQNNGYCELKLYEGLGHGFWNYNRSIEYFIQTVSEAEQFLFQQNVIDDESNIHEWMSNKEQE